MNVSIKAELACLFGALASQTFALRLNPEQWGFAVLLLVAGGLFGATIAAYAGKRIGLEETVDNLVGKILLNIAAVGVFGPSVLSWWMQWTDADLVEAALLVGGVIALFGVTLLVIIVPKLFSFIRKLDVAAWIMRVFFRTPPAPAAREPEKPSTP